MESKIEQNAEHAFMREGNVTYLPDKIRIN